MWGSMLSQRFRGASLLTLFRGALSQAFVPSYFPFATLCRLSPCFCLNHVWTQSLWSPGDLHHPWLSKLQKRFSWWPMPPGILTTLCSLGWKRRSGRPSSAARRQGGRASARTERSRRRSGDMARERVHGFSGENLPPFMVVHLLEWWSWDINDISKHIKPIIKDINYYDKSPSIIMMETHKRFVVHPKR